VSVFFDGTNVRFTFGIPRGQDGQQGTPGADGAPGEVTNAQLTTATATATAIATTAQNPGGIQPLNLNFSNPPTDGELNQVRDKLNELLTALTRIP
jgi:hypothetical protein